MARGFASSICVGIRSHERHRKPARCSETKLKRRGEACLRKEGESSLLPHCTPKPHSKVGEAYTLEGALRDDARECEHRGAAVKQLGGLHTGGVRLGPAEGVEAEISGGAVRLTLHHLADRIVSERLEDANGAEEKKHLSALDGHVVGRERRDALGGTRRHPAQIDGNVPM